MRTIWKAYWGLVAVTLAIYLVMVVWSLPHITLGAGGLVAFDLRPAGYGFEAAQEFIAALDQTTTEFYLNVQHRLDMAYPALMAAVLGIAIFHLYQKRRVALRYLLAAIPVAGAGFDYLENAAVTRMLTRDLTPEIVMAASRWTMLKSGLTTIAMVTMLALLSAHGWARWKARGNT